MMLALMFLFACHRVPPLTPMQIIEQQEESEQDSCDESPYPCESIDLN